MKTLSTFQEYLSSKVLLPLPSRQYIDDQEQQMLKWAALLPLQPEAKQAEQLEKVFSELMVADLEDSLRLKLAGIAMSASERLITALRKHYVYEGGRFTDSQLSKIAQVESIYYLSIMVYDGIVRRESTSLDYQQQHPPLSGQWKRYLTFTKPTPPTLAVAIYQSLLIYQKLLHEKALCYQKPLPSLWSSLNQLYYLACQHHVTHINLSSVVAAHDAENIHQLYCQICLHSLLNVCAMQRASILLIQHFLPVWTNHIVATTEPQTATRVFVNVRGDSPPTYLTAHSTINPYDEQHDCLFIELAPLVAYLQSHAQAVVDDNNHANNHNDYDYNENDSESEIRCLMTKVWMVITYRYLEPPLTVPTKYSPKQCATVFTGFNNIHYHAAGAQSLISLIDIKKLSHEQQPRYNTLPEVKLSDSKQKAEIFIGKDATAHFRMLRLLTMPEAVNLPVAKVTIPLKPSTIRSADLTTNLIADENLRVPANISIGNDCFDSVPALLRVMTLILLCDADTPVGSTSSTSRPKQRSIGIVRWINFDRQSTNSQGAIDQNNDSKSNDNKSQSLEVEWQLLGNEFTACALRLDDKGSRSQHFVPVLLIGADQQLQTVSSLLLPASHFRTNDKVMLRLGDKQKPLRLQRCLLSTQEFSQYEVVRL